MSGCTADGRGPRPADSMRPVEGLDGSQRRSLSARWQHAERFNVSEDTLRSHARAHDGKSRDDAALPPSAECVRRLAAVTAMAWWLLHIRMRGALHTVLPIPTHQWLGAYACMGAHASRSPARRTAAAIHRLRPA